MHICVQKRSFSQWYLAHFLCCCSFDAADRPEPEKKNKKNRPNRTLISNKPNFVQNRMHFCPAEKKKKINEVSGKRHYLGGRSLRLQSKPLHRYDFNILYMQTSSHRHWHGHWPVHSAVQPTGQHFCKDNLEYLTIKDQIFESET